MKFIYILGVFFFPLPHWKFELGHVSSLIPFKFHAIMNNTLSNDTRNCQLKHKCIGCLTQSDNHFNHNTNVSFWELLNEKFNLNVSDFKLCGRQLSVKHCSLILRTKFVFLYRKTIDGTDVLVI